MFIRLDLENDKPIYTQIVEQIIEGIAKKELLPGDRLPSVRNLASDISVNMHTVNKAYQELRRRGYLLIHRQRGVMIHPEGPPKIDDLFLREIDETLRPIIAEAICRGMTEEEFEYIIRETFKNFGRS